MLAPVFILQESRILSGPIFGGQAILNTSNLEAEDLDHLICSLVSNVKEVKARLYGKDGYAVEKPISMVTLIPPPRSLPPVTPLPEAVLGRERGREAKRERKT